MELILELQKYVYKTIENKKIIISLIHNVNIEYSVDGLYLKIIKFEKIYITKSKNKIKLSNLILLLFTQTSKQNYYFLFYYFLF